MRGGASGAALAATGERGRERARAKLLVAPVRTRVCACGTCRLVGHGGGDLGNVENHGGQWVRWVGRKGRLICTGSGLKKWKLKEVV